MLNHFLFWMVAVLHHLFWALIKRVRTHESEVSMEAGYHDGGEWYVKRIQCIPQFDFDLYAFSLWMPWGGKRGKGQVTQVLKLSTFGWSKNVMKERRSRTYLHWQVHSVSSSARLFFFSVLNPAEFYRVSFLSLFWGVELKGDRWMMGALQWTWRSENRWITFSEAQRSTGCSSGTPGQFSWKLHVSCLLFVSIDNLPFVSKVAKVWKHDLSMDQGPIVPPPNGIPSPPPHPPHPAAIP